MKNYKILDATAIKLIAIVAMTIDHIAWTIYPGYAMNWKPELMHIIGRITMPTMCFFIAEGFFHTRNVNKYTFRMFLFALISHFAYVFEWNGFSDWRPFVPLYYSGIWQAIRFRDISFLNAFCWHSQTSVIWTLAWGLVMLRVVVNNIMMEGLVISGSYSFNGTASTWTSQSGSAAMKLTEDLQRDETEETSPFLVIPNNYGAKTLSVDVTWTEWGEEQNRTYTAPLAIDWVAGYAYTYTLTITKYELIVDEDKFTEQW